MGGQHAPKGGHGSLEGMVFFSTRSPEKASSSHVRDDLRSGPRRYAKGSSSSVNSPAQAGLRYQMANTLAARAASAESWQPTARSQSYHAESSVELIAHLAVELQREIGIQGQRTAPNHAESFERAMSALPLRESVTMHKRNGEHVRVSGEALRGLYGEAAAALQRQHEAPGALPYLCLMNRGRVVPVVFGFEKVEGLQTHQLPSGKQHAYQPEAHPLSGSSQGGRLTEIEVGSMADLATLSLACLARGVPLPPDVAVRINPPAQEKRATGRRAEYLTPQQLRGFQASLAQRAQSIAGPLSQLPVDTLQYVNDDARAWAAGAA